MLTTPQHLRDTHSSIYVFMSQLLFLLSLTLECEQTDEVLGDENRKELRARMQEIDVLLTSSSNERSQQPLHHECEEELTHVTDKEKRRSSAERLDNNNPKQYEQNQSVLTLSHLLALVEWILTRTNFYWLLHVYIIHSKGGEKDAFYGLLISLFTRSVANARRNRQVVSSTDRPTQPLRGRITRSFSLKELLSEWRRLSTVWRRRKRKRQLNPDPLSVHHPDDSWGVHPDKEHDDSPAAPSKMSKEREESMRPMKPRARSFDETRRPVKREGQPKQEILCLHPHWINRMEDADEESRAASIENLFTSINLLFHILYMSLLPVISWTYLTRCVYPSSSRKNDDSINEGQSHHPLSSCSFVEDDIRGLESVVVTALRYSNRDVLDRKAILPILSVATGSLSVYGRRQTGWQDAKIDEDVETQKNLQTPRGIAACDSHSPSQRVSSSMIDFALIKQAQNDDRVIESSKGRSTNPYLQSAMASMMPLSSRTQKRLIDDTTLLLGGVADSRDAVLARGQEYDTHHPRYYFHGDQVPRCSILVAGCREMPFANGLLHLVEWTERLRPYLMLQALRVIRVEILPLLPSLGQSIDTEPQHNSVWSRSSLKNPAPSNSGRTVQVQSFSQQRSPFLGLLVSFSCLHQWIASLVSFEFQPVQCFLSHRTTRPARTGATSSSSIPNQHSFDLYRCPVDEEFMIESFGILTLLHSLLASYPIMHDSAEKGSDDQPKQHQPKQFSSVVQSSLTESSFQRSLDLCLLRSQYEILPRSVLMMLSYRNIIKKTTSG